jgi:hypothetical protein
MGPKQPNPNALMGSNLRCARLKNSTQAANVDAGLDVGSTTLSSTLSGEVPTAHTNLVPPPSMAPYSTVSSSLRG